MSTLEPVDTPATEDEDLLLPHLPVTSNIQTAQQFSHLNFKIS